MIEPKKWPTTLKKTKNRLAVYEILSHAFRPITILEIEERLKEKDITMWLSTLYRVLISLQEANLINKTTLLDNTALYEISDHSHFHYAICLKCHQVIELTRCAMDLYQQELSNSNFQIQGHKIEIYGYCSNCRQ